MQTIPYILSIAFTWCFVMYSRYQFKDERKIDGKEHDQWHPWGAWMRGLFFMQMIAMHYVDMMLVDTNLALAISMPLFDVGVNLIALNQSAFYVGKSANSDRKLGMWKWPAYLIYLIGSIILKIYVKI